MSNLTVKTTEHTCLTPEMQKRLEEEGICTACTGDNEYTAYCFYRGEERIVTASSRFAAVQAMVEELIMIDMEDMLV